MTSSFSALHQKLEISPYFSFFELAYTVDMAQEEMREKIRGLIH